MLPAVQAAAVAATGFVAGAATLALVKRHTARKLARTRQSRRALDALPIIGSRSFLVDVHLIARDPGSNQ
jgi:type IV secretory pathway TraG/TraD family ATPase VirD4